MAGVSTGTACLQGGHAGAYLLRDRDAIYGERFRRRLHSLGITEVLLAPRSPRQSPYVERLIGSIRRDCLDHVIVLNERHLKRLLGSYARYYNHISYYTPRYVVEKSRLA